MSNYWGICPVCGQCEHYTPSDDIDLVGWCEKFMTDISAAIVRENRRADGCVFFCFGATPERMRELSEKYGVDFNERLRVHLPELRQADDSTRAARGAQHF